jgi:alkylation response protein AidB-like acyl-CoA dehydrogenase
MHFAFNEEQEELRRSARGFLREHSYSEAVRRAMESERGYDESVWKQIGAQLGWTGITIPEHYGGLGLTYIELVALLEDMGAHLLCSPYFSTICLATNALLLGSSEIPKTELLPAIAAGQLTATLAYTEENGRWDANAITAVSRKNQSGYVLDGVKTFVPDGHTAAVLVVAARREGTTGEDGVGLFVVRGDAPGVTRRLLPTMDQTRKQAEIRLETVQVPASALLTDEDAGWPVLSEALDLAAIALAAEQVGGAQRCLDMTVEYAKERVQFGRPIGSFQAIKHKCADMLLLVESARSASYYAGWAASVQADDLAATASLAKAYCSDAYFRCASEAIQVHGGVGFTWEYDVHLHFKRAKSTETFLGDATRHRELVASRIGL